MVTIDEFEILNYENKNFQKLPLKTKILAYNLAQSCLAGRNIYYDQNYKHNLTVRKTISELIKNKKTPVKTRKKLEEYQKLVWINSGVHHAYKQTKHKTTLTKKEIETAINQINKTTEEKQQLKKTLLKAILGKKDNKLTSLDSKTDRVKTSAVNLYENINEKEATHYYEQKEKEKHKQPLSHGMNSKLTKKDGEIHEETYKLNGKYHNEIKQIIHYLKSALPYAENQKQKTALKKLIKFYTTGNLQDWNNYLLSWIKDTNSKIDLISGFIEVLKDPLGRKGSYQGILVMKDEESSKIFKKLSENTKYFEKNAPIPNAYKKPKPSPLEYNLTEAIMETGDASPLGWIGENLPNEEWIREKHGSKAFNYANKEEALKPKGKKSKTLNEFFTKEQIKLQTKYGGKIGKLATGMHEVLGHSSGQIKKGTLPPSTTLKEHASYLEETRAELFALYYLLDPKLKTLGLIKNKKEAHAQYDLYINGMLTLMISKIPLGQKVEQTHMRARKLIAEYTLEKAKPQKIIIEEKINKKTYYQIRNYEKVREIFAELLHEVQRIKSEGDKKAADKLTSKYLKINPKIHKEMHQRYKKLNVPKYVAFLNPKFNITKNKQGNITSVKLTHKEDLKTQHARYDNDY